MRHNVKRIIAFMLVLCLVLPSITACGSKEKKKKGGVDVSDVESFSDAVELLSEYKEGKYEVTIKGKGDMRQNATFDGTVVLYGVKEGLDFTMSVKTDVAIDSGDSEVGRVKVSSEVEDLLIVKNNELYLNLENLTKIYVSNSEFGTFKVPVPEIDEKEFQNVYKDFLGELSTCLERSLADAEISGKKGKYKVTLSGREDFEKVIDNFVKYLDKHAQKIEDLLISAVELVRMRDYARTLKDELREDVIATIKYLAEKYPPEDTDEFDLGVEAIERQVDKFFDKLSDGMREGQDELLDDLESFSKSVDKDVIPSYEKWDRNDPEENPFLSIDELTTNLWIEVEEEGFETGFDIDMHDQLGTDDVTMKASVVCNFEVDSVSVKAPKETKSALDIAKYALDHRDSYVEEVGDLVRKQDYRGLIGGLIFPAIKRYVDRAEEYRPHPVPVDPTPTPAQPGTNNEPSSSGMTLNIACPNSEFPIYMRYAYPRYEYIDETTGRIGKITVKWHMVDVVEDEYWKFLNSSLNQQQTYFDADTSIDLFVADPDYIGRYLESDYLLPLSRLDISESMLSNQFRYSYDSLKDNQGALKALSWYTCPGVLIYNRQMAKEVFGTDDPAIVQQYVRDWDTYLQTAEFALGKRGYKINASINETYRVFRSNCEEAWLDGNELCVDNRMKQWADLTKRLYDNGYIYDNYIWDWDWTEKMKVGTDVFCYFGPDWFYDFCLKNDDENDIAYQGGWAICNGPESFEWSGSALCVPKGTDNADLVRDILTTLCLDDEAMKIGQYEQKHFLNNKRLMNTTFANTISSCLGNQKTVPYLYQAAENMKTIRRSRLDAECNENFVFQMFKYIRGEATYDEALYEFRNTMRSWYYVD